MQIPSRQSNRRRLSYYENHEDIRYFEGQYRGMRRLAPIRFSRPSTAGRVAWAPGGLTSPETKRRCHRVRDTMVESTVLYPPQPRHGLVQEPAGPGAVSRAYNIGFTTATSKETRA